MGLYYFETDYGCGIREYSNIEEAYKCGLEEHGKRNFIRAREAEIEDIKHVKSACGLLPDAAILLLAKSAT